jgi:hypothetical protein
LIYAVKQPILFEWHSESQEWTFMATSGPAGSASLAVDRVQLDFDRICPGVLTRAVFPLHPGEQGTRLLSLLIGRTWKCGKEALSGFYGLLNNTIAIGLSRIAALDEDQDLVGNGSDDHNKLYELEYACGLAALATFDPEFAGFIGSISQVAPSKVLEASRAGLPGGEAPAALWNELATTLSQPTQEASWVRNFPAPAAELDETHRSITCESPTPVAFEITTPKFLDSMLAGGAGFTATYEPARLTITGIFSRLPDRPVYASVGIPGGSQVRSKLTFSGADQVWIGSQTFELPHQSHRVSIEDAFDFSSPDYQLDSWACLAKARDSGNKAYCLEMRGDSTAAAELWRRCGRYWLGSGSESRASKAFFRAAELSVSDEAAELLGLAHSLGSEFDQPTNTQLCFRAWLAFAPSSPECGWDLVPQHTSKNIFRPHAIEDSNWSQPLEKRDTANAG